MFSTSIASVSRKVIYGVYAGIKTATTRTQNRTLPNLEPHFAGGKPHQFQIRDYPFFTFSIKVHYVMQIIEVALTRWRIQIAPPTVLSASGAMFMIYSLVLL